MKGSSVTNRYRVRVEMIEVDGDDMWISSQRSWAAMPAMGYDRAERLYEAVVADLETLLKGEH